MTDINKLINKYYRPDGKNRTGNFQITNSEMVSNEYDLKLKSENRRKHRHLLLDELLNETPFTLTSNQITQIRYWIDTFNDDFKGFHRQASNETIILSFIMMQQKNTNPRLNVEKYTISQKYNLNNTVFETIQNKLIFRLMRTLPLIYNQARYVNHEILIKEGKRHGGTSNE